MWRAHGGKDALILEIVDYVRQNVKKESWDDSNEDFDCGSATCSYCRDGKLEKKIVYVIEEEKDNPASPHQYVNQKCSLCETSNLHYLCETCGFLCSQCYLSIPFHHKNKHQYKTLCESRDQDIGKSGPKFSFRVDGPIRYSNNNNVEPRSTPEEIYKRNIENGALQAARDLELDRQSQNFANNGAICIDVLEEEKIRKVQADLLKKITNPDPNDFNLSSAFTFMDSEAAAVVAVGNTESLGDDKEEEEEDPAEVVTREKLVESKNILPNSCINFTTIKLLLFEDPWMTFEQWFSVKNQWKFEDDAISIYYNCVNRSQCYTMWDWRVLDYVLRGCINDKNQLELEIRRDDNLLIVVYERIHDLSIDDFLCRLKYYQPCSACNTFKKHLANAKHLSSIIVCSGQYGGRFDECELVFTSSRVCAMDKAKFKWVFKALHDSFASLCKDIDKQICAFNETITPSYYSCWIPESYAYGYGQENLKNWLKTHHIADFTELKSALGGTPYADAYRSLSTSTSRRSIVHNSFSGITRVRSDRWDGVKRIFESGVNPFGDGWLHCSKCSDYFSIFKECIQIDPDRVKCPHCPYKYTSDLYLMHVGTHHK
jgi:hypothetical protein